MPCRFSLGRALSLAALLFLAPAVLAAQSVGDQVFLESSNPAGIPVHPAAGDNTYWRWANGTIGIVRTIDPATGWLEIDAAGSLGWVTPRYVTVIGAEEEDPEDEILSYVVGTWNLEHFKDGAQRGFPENRIGGESYPPRTDEDFLGIAETIRDRLDAKIMILNEVNGITGEARSVELDRLLTHLGAGWAYEISLSGRAQRLAILYDATAARRETCHEIEVPEERIGEDDVFARDPLTCLFTFLDPAGRSMNDLVVVALHLASGQTKHANHDRAMAILQRRLTALFDGSAYPAGERDILIGGDLNASRYDSYSEDFWEEYDAAGFAFRTLAPADGTLYEGTRLAGHPLRPKSQIDYLFASATVGGLAADLTQVSAHVHVELLPNDFTEFRRRWSDHLPVTIRIRVQPDDDPGT